jgi:hypothetical protein
VGLLYVTHQRVRYLRRQNTRLRSWEAARRANSYSLPTRHAAVKSLLHSLCTPQNRRFHEGRAFPLLISCYDSDEVLHVQGLCFMFCELTADMTFKQLVFTPYFNIHFARKLRNMTTSDGLCSSINIHSHVLTVSR